MKEYVDFEVILSLLFLRRKTLLLCILVSCAVAAGVSLVMPKKYEATVTILAEPRKEDNPYLLDANSQQERKAFIETQKEIVVSRSVLLPTLIQNRRTSGDADSPVTKEEIAKSDVEEKDIQALQSELRVASRSGMGKSLFGGSGIGESSTFFVTMTSDGPKDAAAGVNRLVRNYLRESGRVRASQASGAEEELEMAVKTSTELTKQAHAELVKFESETGPLLAELVALDKPTVRVYPELSEIRSAYETDKASAAKVRAEIEGLEAALQAEGEPPIPGDLMLGNPSLSGMKAAIANIQVEINRLAPFYTEDAREVKAANEKMGAAIAAFREEVGRVIAGHKQYLKTLEAGLKSREASIAYYDGQLKKLSESNARYAELKREYTGTAATLDQQIRALTEAHIAANGKSTSVANIAVIDWARENAQPVSPRPLLNTILAFFIGAGLGVIVVLVGHFLQPVLVHPREVESLTQLPVVAILPVRS